MPVSVKELHQLNYKFHSYTEFWEFLPDDQRELVDYLRAIVLKALPGRCKEKFAYNVPCYYGKRMICMIWPAAVPRGGIKEGVLFGFAQGRSLKDVNNHLKRGTNKKVFYKIYRSLDEIEEEELKLLMEEAIELDSKYK